MTPQELENKFDDAQAGPAIGKRPREVGALKDDYRPHAEVPHLTAIKSHMRALTSDDWAQFARAVRRGRIMRLCNDEVLIALLRLWMGAKP